MDWYEIYCQGITILILLLVLFKWRYNMDKVTAHRIGFILCVGSAAIMIGIITGIYLKVF